MLVTDMLRGLIMMRVVVWLLCGVRVMRLCLKFGHLHTKPLVSLAAAHHDMLALVSLAVHCEGI
jgi:hypothetical protein